VFLSLAVLPNLAYGQATLTTCIGRYWQLCDTTVSSINLGAATVGGGAFVPVKNHPNYRSATLTIKVNAALLTLLRLA